MPGEDLNLHLLNDLYVRKILQDIECLQNYRNRLLVANEYYKNGLLQLLRASYLMRPSHLYNPAPDLARINLNPFDEASSAAAPWNQIRPSIFPPIQPQIMSAIPLYDNNLLKISRHPVNQFHLENTNQAENDYGVIGKELMKHAKPKPMLQQLNVSLDQRQSPPPDRANNSFYMPSGSREKSTNNRFNPYTAYVPALHERCVADKPKEDKFGRENDLISHNQREPLEMTEEDMYPSRHSCNFIRQTIAPNKDTGSVAQENSKRTTKSQTTSFNWNNFWTTDIFNNIHTDKEAQREQNNNSETLSLTKSRDNLENDAQNSTREKKDMKKKFDKSKIFNNEYQRETPSSIIKQEVQVQVKTPTPRNRVHTTCKPLVHSIPSSPTLSIADYTVQLLRLAVLLYAPSLMPALNSLIARQNPQSSLSSTVSEGSNDLLTHVFGLLANEESIPILPSTFT